MKNPTLILILQKSEGKLARELELSKNYLKVLQESFLLIIYKSFIRTHQDYGNIVDDQPDNESFISKLIKFNFNDALATAGVIKCTSRSKGYKELGRKSLEPRRKLRRLRFLQDIISNGLYTYLYKLITKKLHQHITRNVYDIGTYQCRTDAFKFSFSFFETSIGIKFRNVKSSFQNHIQFSETICSKKLDHNLILYTTFTVHLGLNYLLD